MLVVKAALFWCLPDPFQEENIQVAETKVCVLLLWAQGSVKVRTVSKPAEASLFFQPSALTIVNKGTVIIDPTSLHAPHLQLKFSQFPLMQQAALFDCTILSAVAHCFLSIFLVEMPKRTTFLYRDGEPIQTGLNVLFMLWTQFEVTQNCWVHLVGH